MNEQRSYGMMNLSAASRLKRKDRESIFPAKRSSLAPAAPQPPLSPSSRRATATASNKLLAGYMAHEFLTRGTVLGQKFDNNNNNNQNLNQNQNQNLNQKKQSAIEVETEKWRKGKETSSSSSYKEITSLMMMKSSDGGGGGVHIPGIVNPTQLDRWIQQM